MTWLKKILSFIKELLKDKPQPLPPADPAYTVAPGQRVEQVAESLRFDIVPARDGDPATEDVVVWAYTEGGDFAGGNPGPGTMSVRVNCYNASALKCKVYGIDAYAGEPKLPCGWLKGEKYAVELMVKNNMVTLTVNGRMVTVACLTGGPVVMGYGWPPSVRQGCLGAKITEVRWG